MLAAAARDLHLLSDDEAAARRATGAARAQQGTTELGSEQQALIARYTHAHRGEALYLCVRARVRALSIDSTDGILRQRLVSRADAFYLASVFMGDTEAGGDRGCDCSHRGGNPGFVQFQAPGTLRWGDYVRCLLCAHLRRTVL